jgi:hypothetical protein
VTRDAAEIRRLEEADAAIFQALRLGVLEDDPASFLASSHKKRPT